MNATVKEFHALIQVSIVASVKEVILWSAVRPFSHTISWLKRPQHGLALLQSLYASPLLLPQPLGGNVLCVEIGDTRAGLSLERRPGFW